MISYIKNEQHYNLLLEQIAKVKHTLWIGTADLKDLYVKKGNKTVPFLALLDDKVRQGISVRLFYWMKKAMEQGDPECQYELGNAYDCGKGVEPDLEESVKWYRLAAKLGDEDAKNALKSLQNEG